MLVCLLLLLFNSDKNKFTIILQIDSMCFQKISIAVVKTDSYSTFRTKHHGQAVLETVGTKNDRQPQAACFLFNGWGLIPRTPSVASLRCILTSAWASTAEGSFLWIIVP